MTAKAEPVLGMKPPPSPPLISEGQEAKRQQECEQQEHEQQVYLYI
jgi:hypothetical protein